MKCRVCGREFVGFTDGFQHFMACPVHNPIIDGTYTRTDMPEEAS